jgi:Ca2+-binding EF-hand superfamily protein
MDGKGIISKDELRKILEYFGFTRKEIEDIFL